jgi:hypothetical protein
MCRSIKVLRVPGRRATEDELTAAALQFVRKISGFRKPSRNNQEAFDRAVAEIAASSKHLLSTMKIPDPPKVPETIEAATAETASAEQRS